MKGGSVLQHMFEEEQIIWKAFETENVKCFWALRIFCYYHTFMGKVCAKGVFQFDKSVYVLFEVIGQLPPHVICILFYGDFLCVRNYGVYNFDSNYRQGPFCWLRLIVFRQR